VEYLGSEEGLLIKDMDKSIQAGEINDISKEVQDILQEQVSVARKRKTEKVTSAIAPKDESHPVPTEIYPKTANLNALIAPNPFKEEEEESKSPITRIVGQDTAAPASLTPLKKKDTITRIKNRSSMLFWKDKSSHISISSAFKDEEEEESASSKSPATRIEHGTATLASPTPLKKKDTITRVKSRSSMLNFSLIKNTSASNLSLSSIAPSPQKVSMLDIFMSFESKSAAKVKFEEQLWSGSFGEVWKGTYIHRDVVVKKLFRDNGF
jgi:hypothetical protein